MSSGRIYTVSTPLGDALSFTKMSGVERLSRCFSFEVQALSADPNVSPDALLGLPATVTMESGVGAKRHFNGFIDNLTFLGSPKSDQWLYQFELVPWLAILKKVADCRIFQEITVPDLLKELFSELGFTDFDFRLTRQYPEREYCVQYRESTFNFVSRLMEEEGIYYYFTHSESAHVLVLADDYSGHEPIPGQSSIKFHPDTIGLRPNEDSIAHWGSGTRVLTGQVALNAYNFKTPRGELSTQRLIERGHAQASWEVFDFHDRYPDAEAGDHYTLNRIEELQSDHQSYSGATDSLTMASGGLFTLEQHPRGDQNMEYLAVETRYELAAPEYWSGGDDQEPWRCDIVCMPSATPYRPARVTPRPSVRGPQTATVVGPPNEEIYPDEFGRIKVQFPWDRYGSMDQNSSCWIRVAQSFAGPGFGAQYIPRIGHEVMVVFLEGDPDRPLVMGNVYNGSNAPPYSLPGSKTQSGVKTRSSPGGGASNANEIRFEDKTGSEEFYIQAEKDERILVKNCKSENVGVDETITIGHDRTETIGNDETRTVGNNETVSVGVDQEHSVGNNRKHTVAKNEDIKVGVTQNIDVGLSQNINVGGLQAIEVTGAQTTEIGAYQSLEVTGFQSIEVGLNQSLEVGRDQEIEVGKNQSLEVEENQSIKIGDSRSVEIKKKDALKVEEDRATNITKNDSLKVGKDLVIDAGDSITIKTGSASITMKKNGDITLKGKNVTIKASGKLKGKASGQATWKGSSLADN